MTTSKKTMRMRAMTVAGGIAIIGTTGAGLAGGADAATSSSAATSTLAKIKYCESGGNYQAVNSSSGASGAYQFLNSTWKGLSAGHGYATAASAPASVQDAAALELYNQAGTSPWAASSGCWSHLSGVRSSSSASTTTATTSSSTTAATTTSSGTNAKTTTTSAQLTSVKTAAKKTNSTPSRALPGKQHQRAGQPKPAPKPVGSACDKGRHHAPMTPHHPVTKHLNKLATAA